MVQDVDIIIERETRPLTRAGFGLPLILGISADQEYTLVSDLDSLAEDTAFGVGSPEYTIAQSIFMQNPRPPMIAVFGVEDADIITGQASVVITSLSGTGAAIRVTATEGDAFDGSAGNDVNVVFVDIPNTGLSVSEDDGTITVDFGGDPDATAAAIAAAITALDDFAGEVVTEGDFTAAADAGNIDESLSGGWDAPLGLEVALNELVEQHNNWYFLLCPVKGEDEVTVLSNWTETRRKLYAFSTAGDVMPEMWQLMLENMRTFFLWHDKAIPPENGYGASMWPEAGWIGRCAPEDPGSITWKFKTIAGVVEANIGVTDIFTLHDNGGQSYINKLGRLQTTEGLTTNGDFIDFVRGEDWIVARMTEAVSQVLFDAPKVPFDDSGIAMIVSAVSSVLGQAFDRGIIAGDAAGRPLYRVDAPARADVSQADLAARVLSGVEFQATLAGAIHEVKPIRGILTLEEVDVE